MGIKGLTDLIKQLFKEVPPDVAERMIKNIALPNVAGSTVVIDFSMIAFQYGNVIVKGDLHAMGSGCTIGFLQLIRQLKKFNIRPIVVFDQVLEGLDAYSASHDCLELIQKEGIVAAKDIDVATILQAKTETRLGRIETRGRIEESSGRIQFRVTNELVSAIEHACKILDVETYHPLVEADWLLACIANIESSRGPTYIISEDTDLLIYDIGAAKVLRRFSLSGGDKRRGNEYQVVDPAVIWEELNLLDLNRRAYLAAILGCDYFEGVYRLGAKAVMHILQSEPRYCRSKTIRGAYTQELASRASQGITTSGLVDSSVFMGRLSGPGLAKHIKEFTRRRLSPRCFNGYTIEEIRALCGTVNVPLVYVDSFLSEYYDNPITGDKFAQFKHAVQVIQLGPMIEEKYLTRMNRSKGLVRGDCSATPMSRSEGSTWEDCEPELKGGGDPSLGAAVREYQRQDLARILMEAFGDNAFRTVIAFQNLDIHILDLLKDAKTDRLAALCGSIPDPDPVLVIPPIAPQSVEETTDPLPDLEPESEPPGPATVLESHDSIQLFKGEIKRVPGTELFEAMSREAHHQRCLTEGCSSGEKCDMRVLYRFYKFRDEIEKEIIRVALLLGDDIKEDAQHLGVMQMLEYMRMQLPRIGEDIEIRRDLYDIASRSPDREELEEIWRGSYSDP
jgi:5'-3' exonuclease